MSELPKQDDEQPVGESQTIAHVTKAILFADCGNTEDWPDNLDLGEAAVKAMRQHIQRWRDDAFEASAVLAERHDCPACADDIRALKATPRPADPDLLALVDELEKLVIEMATDLAFVEKHSDAMLERIARIRNRAMSWSPSHWMPLPEPPAREGEKK